jgi:hypothetical protein
VLREVTDLLDTHILAPERRKEIEAEVERRVREDAAGSPDQTARLKARVGELEAKVKQAARRYMECPPEMTEDAAAVYKALREEKAEAEERLARLKEAAAQVKDVGKVVRSVMQAIEDIYIALLFRPDPDAKRAVFRRLIDTVVVDFEDVPVGRSLRSEPKQLWVTLRKEAFTVRSLVATVEPLTVPFRRSAPSEGTGRCTRPRTCSAASRSARCAGSWSIPVR